MAEPLKNRFGPEVPVRLADQVWLAYSEFDRERFLRIALYGYEDLELTPRARHISAALEETLPQDRHQAIEVIIRSLGPEIEGDELTGMGTFIYLPFVYFVADNGLDHFEVSMRAQYELTKRFTAEFSIRAFLDRFPERTLAVLEEWAADDNTHVRRLVSEGTRPRLPWSPRLTRFQEDPLPVIGLLEMLKDDPAEYVRRSVANNLNDIAKDHPDLVVAVAEDWWRDGDENRRRMLRHGLRTLIKAGHPGALALLGYGPESPVVLSTVSVDPPELSIGESVRISAELSNPSTEPGPALVDFIVHFVKANGSSSPKVFKGGERVIEPGNTATVSKRISMAQFSTRTNHPGRHRVEIQLNGSVHGGGWFDLS